VILAPDASAGAVVVHVRYRAGSAHDRPDKTGLAQAVARVDGSAHVSATVQSEAIEASGGWNTSSLDRDHLGYTTYVPANALARALYFEADRMAGLRDVVNGRHPRVLSIGRHRDSSWRSELDRALWPQATLTPGGQGTAVSDADIVEWWGRFGAPGNATLVVAGAFDATEAKHLVERYFAWIPARPTRFSTMPEVAPLGHEAEILSIGDVSTTTLVVAFRTPEPLASATADLDVVGRIMAGGKAARLYRRLVIADRNAVDVSASFATGSRGGELAFEITVAHPAVLARVQAAVFDELAKLHVHGATADEVARAKAGILHDKLLALEGLSFRAEDLAAWSAYRDTFDAWRARLDAVTASSLQVTSQRWLTADTAVVMSILPGGR
jgi:zinc protease